MIKLGFPLDVQDNWPPYDVEHLWAEQAEIGYTIDSIPFFLKDLALGDLISARIGKYNYVTKWSITQKSGNSTVWIMELHKNDSVDRLKRLGCQVEGGEADRLYAVNVPRELKFNLVEGLLSSYLTSELIEIAYPAVRHVT
jgi:Domain of unknown function (DUF4265)